MADKKSASKGEVGIYNFYKVEGDKITRTKRDCPRCGKGTFMAQHKNRLTCGKCGYTEFMHNEGTKNIKK
jgi:ubiquitin-small subunit ribosomal protein S27Ae